MAMEFGTGLATNATNAIIGILGQQLKDVRELGKNLQLLNNELDLMEESLRHIQTQFEDQQKKLPKMVEDCLGRINNALEDVKTLIQRANRQRERGRGCCLFFSPNIPADIREWKTRFGELVQQLQSDLSIVANMAQIVGSAQRQEEALLQPLPESGFVGTGIEAAQRQLSAWLDEPHPLARVVGVWGMAGVGKTALLQLIYNNCIKKVSGSFDFVIWYTISQNYQIQSLQDTIAESLNLNLKRISSVDLRKMKLYAFLENKRFLLVLDDAWNPIDLNEVGINFGHDNGSKLLMSSRSRDVVEVMAEKEYCMMIRPLSTEEGWALFRRRAFRCGAAPDNNLEVIARQVALECKGLPLAINRVAATMAGKKTADEWSRALVLLKNVDPSFPSTHRTIDAGAAFPEDARIDVFINHRGQDTKAIFASHLYRRLLSHGFRAFLDEQELEAGFDFPSQIVRAIRTASVHVAIFSPTYTESTWCLNELILMRGSGCPIIPVFYKVSPAELRYGNPLHALEMKTNPDPETGMPQPRYDSATIKNWRNALSTVADISGFDLEGKFHGDVIGMLDEVVESMMKRVKKTVAELKLP